MRATAGIYKAHHNKNGAVSVIANNGNLLGVKLDEFDWICPYGKPGDLLWVRESFYIQDWLNLTLKEPQPLYYAVDCRSEEVEDYKKIPSIFMPRWASRITLEIKGIRVERLQAICHGDAFDEGCPDHNWLPRLWFKKAWDKINVKRGYGWDTNPFVWVIIFKKRAAVMAGIV